MRKKLIGLLVIVSILVTVACGSDGSTGTGKRNLNNTKSVNDVLNAGMAADDAKNGNSASSEDEVYYDKNTGTVTGRQSGLTENAPDPEKIPDGVLNGEDGIDIDLTKLSATMVYSEIYDMMVYPDKYIGKTVKMNGMLSTLHDEVNDIYYFACIITDATACCAQGIEFVATDEFKYPEDYPEEGGDITVVGVFDTYWEGNYIYCTLRNAKIL
jgi:hypothetical protein